MISSDDEIKAFNKCEYWVNIDNKEILVQINQPIASEVLELFKKYKIESFLIITAFNPECEILTESENRRRTLKLGQYLTLLKDVNYFYTKHIDPSGEWPKEEGYLIWNLPLSRSVEIAKDQSQKAFIYTEKNDVPKLHFAY